MLELRPAMLPALFGKRACRLDAGTALHIARAQNQSGQMVITLGAGEDLKVDPTIAGRCMRLMLIATFGRSLLCI